MEQQGQNQTVCGKCAHFDQQYVMKGLQRQPAWYGWCRKKSKYPAKEWNTAQPFDVGVERVTANRSIPYVVDAKAVLTTCTDVVPSHG